MNSKVLMVLLLSLIAVSCKTIKKRQPPAPPPKKEFKLLAPEKKIVILPPREVILPFKYPPNASNYIWSVQVSTNLKTWTTITNGMYWPPSTNGDIFTSHTNRMMFYRLWGHQK